CAGIAWVRRGSESCGSPWRRTPRWRSCTWTSPASPRRNREHGQLPEQELNPEDPHLGGERDRRGWEGQAEGAEASQAGRLRAIGNFVDDLGLLQAYLDWVEELRADRDQMDSVRNVDALQSVLKGLRVAGAHGEGQNAQKAKELETKILQLLETPT
ncbi:hypothetical protein ANANG_G00002750, partial [Anguilla anguilla]